MSTGPIYDTHRINANFLTNPAKFMPLMAISMGVGFVEYIVCFVMTRRDKKSPFSIHQHAYYLAHDFAYASYYRRWFQEYNVLAWQGTWAGMVAFNVFEIYCLYLAIRDERQYALGDYIKGRVSVLSATLFVSIEVYLFWSVVNYAIECTHDHLFFQIFWTMNAFMAVAPALIFANRRERYPGQLLLAFLIFLGTCLTFAPPPIGMWTSADSAFFDRKEYYLIGAGFVLTAVWHVILVLRSKVISSPAVRVSPERVIRQSALRFAGQVRYEVQFENHERMRFSKLVVFCCDQRALRNFVLDLIIKLFKGARSLTYLRAMVWPWSRKPPSTPQNPSASSPSSLTVQTSSLSSTSSRKPRSSFSSFTSRTKQPSDDVEIELQDSPRLSAMHSVTQQESDSGYAESLQLESPSKEAPSMHVSNTPAKTPSKWKLPGRRTRADSNLSLSSVGSGRKKGSEAQVA